jgi:separase
MSSSQATADFIRDAVTSTSTCSPATVKQLSDLLLPKVNGSKSDARSISGKASKAPVGGKSKSTTSQAKPRATTAADKDGDAQGDGDRLSPKERSILATEVINSALKALSEAIRAPAPLRKKESAKELVKSSFQKSLRRSSSVPQSPIQPRSLNRISTSPSVSTGLRRSSSLSSFTSSGNRSTAECARISFACLRALHASKLPGVNLPHLQLESGMSVLIGKLISLGLDDLAVKELVILKKRLDEEDGNPSKCGPALKTKHSASAPQTLAGFLEFGDKSFSGEKLGLAITTQIQVLRIIASTRNYKQLEAALPSLQPSHSSSPTKLLLIAATDSKTDKYARQLQSLSEILLSLSPSVSPADDTTALDPSLSVQPEVAFQLQMISLHSRIMWWKLVGHKADFAKELLDPFLRCLSSFTRRNRRANIETHRLSVSAFRVLQEALPGLEETKTERTRLTLIGIYRLFGSISQEANLIEEAIGWTQKVLSLLDPRADSDAKRCAVATKLVGLSLRRSTRHSKDEEQLLSLLDVLERPFKGDSSEIDDLLTEVSAVRRVAITILANGDQTGCESTDSMREMCESLVLMCPRLSLRYIGNSPDANSATKEIVRHEQRRQFITKSAMHAIDSVLFLIKTFLSERRSTWELIDSKLQDCLLLLERLDESFGQALPENESSTPSSYVRISNLYFTQYLNMRRDSHSQKNGQQIRALKRSIDCVRSRSQQEKKAALLSMKLERMAEICKTTGRYDELSKTLLSLRDEMVCNGVLSAIAAATATGPAQAAWSQNEETAVLGRTIQALLKVQMKYLSPASQASLLNGPWSDDERGAVLEHLLETLSSSPNPSSKLQIKLFQELLLVYDRQRFPVRRMRVLSRLLYLDPGQRHAVSGDISVESDLLATKDLIVKGTKDEGLEGFVTHLQALNMTILELQRERPQIEVFKRSFVLWTNIRAQCDNLTSLQLQIEDLDAFLVHLQLIADYMQLKGLDTTRLSLLRLIKDYNELRPKAANSDEFVLSLIHLGVQWARIGYSGKAGLVLDQAQGYCNQNGALKHTWLQLHLAYAENLLSIGNFDKRYISPYILASFANEKIVRSILYRLNKYLLKRRNTDRTQSRQ